MEELCNRSRCLALTINGIILAFVCLMLMLPRKTSGNDYNYFISGTTPSRTRTNTPLALLGHQAVKL